MSVDSDQTLSTAVSTPVETSTNNDTGLNMFQKSGPPSGVETSTNNETGLNMFQKSGPLPDFKSLLERRNGSSVKKLSHQNYSSVEVNRPEMRHHLIDIHGLALFLRKATRCFQCLKTGCLSMMGNISRQQPPCVTNITIRCQSCSFVLHESLKKPGSSPTGCDTIIPVPKLKSDVMAPLSGNKIQGNSTPSKEMEMETLLQEVWVKEKERNEPPKKKFKKPPIDPLNIDKENNLKTQLSPGTEPHLITGPQNYPNSTDNCDRNEKVEVTVACNLKGTATVHWFPKGRSETQANEENTSTTGITGTSENSPNSNSQPELTTREGGGLTHFDEHSLNPRDLFKNGNFISINKDLIPAPLLPDKNTLIQSNDCITSTNLKLYSVPLSTFCDRSQNSGSSECNTSQKNMDQTLNDCIKAKNDQSKSHTIKQENVYETPNDLPSHEINETCKYINPVLGNQNVTVKESLQNNVQQYNLIDSSNVVVLPPEGNPNEMISSNDFSNKDIFPKDNKIPSVKSNSSYLEVLKYLSNGFNSVLKKETNIADLDKSSSDLKYSKESNINQKTSTITIENLNVSNINFKTESIPAQIHGTESINTDLKDMSIVKKLLNLTEALKNELLSREKELEVNEMEFKDISTTSQFFSQSKPKIKSEPEEECSKSECGDLLLGESINNVQKSFKIEKEPELIVPDIVIKQGNLPHYEVPNPEQTIVTDVSTTGTRDFSSSVYNMPTYDKNEANSPNFTQNDEFHEKKIKIESSSCNFYDLLSN